MKDRPRILIVDDDPHIREVIRFLLEQSMFATEEAGDGVEALEKCKAFQPNLVVLDILMPEMDGTEVCRRLRSESGPSVPIVFLSSKAEELDRVLGLELGGDDYVTKPFSPRELVARIKAVLRRSPEQGSTADRAGDDAALRCGPLVLDPVRFEASWDGRVLPLTVTEFGLLKTLIARPGKVYTRDELMSGAYRDYTVVSDRTINSHVKRLRRKLMAVGGSPIETVYGLGYRLTVRDEDQASAESQE